MVTRRTLTDRQKNLLRCIVKYQEEQGFSLSVSDLCEMTGLRSTSSVHAQLKVLEGSGYRERMRECPRTLAVKREN